MSEPDPPPTVEEMITELSRLEAVNLLLETRNTTLENQLSDLRNQGVFRRRFWQEVERRVALLTEERGDAFNKMQRYRRFLDKLVTALESATPPTRQQIYDKAKLVLGEGEEPQI